MVLALNELKQAPHPWFEKFRTTHLDFHLTLIVVLIVYVEDIVITQFDPQLIEQL